MREYPLRYFKGVGPKRERALQALGVYNLKDLLYYFPFRYEDRRSFKDIADLKEGEFSVIKAEVLVRQLKKIPYFLKGVKVRDIFSAIVADKSGKIECVWFNQPYLSERIKVQDKLILYGKVRRNGGKLQLVCPEYEHIQTEEDSLNLGRIVGVYRISSFLNQKFLRQLLFSALEIFKKEHTEPLPFTIRKENHLPNIVKSLEGIHFPSSFEEAERAKERFIFEELFFSQILVYLRKAKHRLQRGPAFKIAAGLYERIKNNLAFELTPSQKEVLVQIREDLKKPYPMHRLLQGEVGCGKTVVASFCFAFCVDSGYQAALMVPTEVLAYQHKETLERVLAGLGYRIELLVSSLGPKRIKLIREALREGGVDIIVGTHALIQEEVEFKNLGLVVIDEQHKFGVAQRALLPKKGLNPHYLVMSATPIPRSLALSLYGDLDLSVIKDMPSGRKRPRTIWITEGQRLWLYDFLRERLKEGRQAYIVYPVISESEEEDIKSLETMYVKIKERFSDFRVGIFHGRLKPKEKLEAICAFREKKIDILVCTTVVEVGVDIENATVMVVENPERFGLAQLHQLRGRIQRSFYKPYFIMISKEDLALPIKERLKVISEVDDGFRIAEEDLRLRGPGDFFGDLQHGFPDLKIANPLKDLEILKRARLWAFRTVKNDPHLERVEHRSIRQYLERLGLERREDIEFRV